MVVREDKKAVVLQYTVALAEHGLQLSRKLFGIRVLDFVLAASALRWLVGCRLLPGEEEIGQLGVVDVVEERRIGHDQVDAPVGKPVADESPQERAMARGGIGLPHACNSPANGGEQTRPLALPVPLTSVGDSR